LAVHTDSYRKILDELQPGKVTLVAVSKTRSLEEILELYHLGQRDFGENYVQELVEKHARLPDDIRWHFIGHLQSNKVKLIAPFVFLIHSADSGKLVREINKQAKKYNRVIDCLLQVFIAREETKFGLDPGELDEIIGEIPGGKAENKMDNITIRGLMGMASLDGNLESVRKEFRVLNALFEKYKPVSAPGIQFSILSMGMSADYREAIEEGSNMVRIGSLLFGKRNPR
jgi:pyridoxal phosphate enzyme (YggS family)